VVSVPSTTPSQPTHTLTIPLHPPWTFLHPTRSTPQR
jgi:hypothetical protein